MPVTMDPAARRFIDAAAKAAGKPMSEMTIAELRDRPRQMRAIAPSTVPECAEVRDVKIPGKGGQIPLRIYRGIGTKATDILPALVFFHGGGWVIGDLDSHDVSCRNIANQSKSCVISVDYRLAPEHKFPAGVEDSADATIWAAKEAASLKIDPKKIAVGGDSAGGNLAAVVAIMARDGTVPPVCYQALIYPCIDLSIEFPAFERYGDTMNLTRSGMIYYRDLYLNGPKDVSDWRASPIRAADLKGVCPALVLTAGCDPLYEEGIEYARRLEREGVRVLQIHFSDQIHGFVSQAAAIPGGQRALEMIASALRMGWEA